MAFNRTLVVGASAGIGLAGDAAPKVFSYLSFECQQAIRIAAADEAISQACGPTFTDMNLLVIVLVGIVSFLVINFWQDIAGYVQEKTQ